MKYTNYTVLHTSSGPHTLEVLVNKKLDNGYNLIGGLCHDGNGNYLQAVALKVVAENLPIGTWLQSECHPTKRFALRPGWHTAEKPHAPHLKMERRAWYTVEIEDYEELKRPASQGSKWFLSKRMKVIGITRL